MKDSNSFIYCFSLFIFRLFFLFPVCFFIFSIFFWIFSVWGNFCLFSIPKSILLPLLGVVFFPSSFAILIFLLFFLSFFIIDSWFIFISVFIFFNWLLYLFIPNVLLRGLRLFTLFIFFVVFIISLPNSFNFFMECFNILLLLFSSDGFFF